MNSQNRALSFYLPLSMCVTNTNEHEQKKKNTITDFSQTQGTTTATTQLAWTDPEGGTGVQTPPTEKSQKI